MKTELKINQLLLTGFGVIFSIIIIIAILSGMSSRQSKEGLNWVTHTYDVRLQVAEIKKMLVDAETGQRGFLFTGQERYLEPASLL